MTTCIRFAVFAALLGVCQGKTFLITGATGHTGSLVYEQLKSVPGNVVRGVTTNAAKARKVLNCTSCDASDGIYVANISNASSMADAMANVDTLIITVGPAYHCTIPSIFIGCKFYPGADPKTIVWEGLKNQVSMFAKAPGAPLANRHVILLSNDLTTTPDNSLDKIDNSHGCFYALNGEAWLMSSGLPWTIMKPNGLNDGDPAVKQIVIGKDDAGWKPSNFNLAYIHRTDVARMVTYAASNPEKTKGLRFDVTSRRFFIGKPTVDLGPVFEEAKYPWDPRGVEEQRGVELEHIVV